MRSFILQELSQSDIILFSEIMDVALLKEILAPFWHCEGYQRPSNHHHHLALCYKPEKYFLEKYDDDFIIPEVDMGSFGLRPAIQAKLCEKDGDCFAQIIGVHLKAGKASQFREQQIQHIADNLSRQEGDFLPTIILGDFNSHGVEQNKREQHDMVFFENRLSKSGQNFRSLSMGIPTFGTGERGRDFDHIVVSDNIVELKSWAYPSCGDNIPAQSQFIPYYSYRRYFTDHCYITSRLQIKGKTL